MTLAYKIQAVFANGFDVTPQGQVVRGNKYRKQHLRSGGYPSVTIKLNGVLVNFRVHQLQAFKKFGAAAFEPGMVVRHLNGVKTDNSETNIAIGSHSDNRMDMPSEVRRALSAKANLKYDHAAVKAYYNQHRSYRRTMLYFGIRSKSTIHNILNK